MTPNPNQHSERTVPQKPEKYIVKLDDYDPWSSQGFQGIGNLKDVRWWAKDGSFKEGDIVGEFKPKYIFKDGKLQAIHKRIKGAANRKEYGKDCLIAKFLKRTAKSKKRTFMSLKSRKVRNRKERKRTQMPKANKPFYINQRLENGELKDHTKFKIDENGVLRIWFRDLKKWINHPEPKQENRIIRSIEKHGVIYA